MHQTEAVKKTAERIAENWINGNRRDALDALTSSPGMDAPGCIPGLALAVNALLTPLGLHDDFRWACLARTEDDADADVALTYLEEN